jgi:putative transposase
VLRGPESSRAAQSPPNLLVWGIDELVTVVKNRLKRIQYRPELIDAFLAHTGLDLEPP